MHRLRQLDAGRSPAQHYEAPRDGFHAGRLAGAPHAIELAQAGNRRYDRIRSGRDDHVLGRVAHSVDLDDPHPGEPARAAQQLDAPVREPALLAGVGVAGDHEVTPRQRRLDIDLRARRRLARSMCGLAGPQQRLGRDARPVGAFAADQVAFDERDAQTALRERAGAMLARRTPAEDDDVIVVAHLDLRRLVARAR